MQNQLRAKSTNQDPHSLNCDNLPKNSASYKTLLVDKTSPLQSASLSSKKKWLNSQWRNKIQKNQSRAKKIAENLDE